MTGLHVCWVVTGCAGQYVEEVPMQIRVPILEDFNGTRYDDMMTR